MLRIGVLSLQQLLIHLHGRVEILLTRMFLLRGKIAAHFTSWTPATCYWYVGTKSGTLAHIYLTGTFSIHIHDWYL
jgi:hypothetical protein